MTASTLLVAAFFPASIAAQKLQAEGALGTVDFSVSCEEEAQARFNRALALLHHMTYPVARAAFSSIAVDFPDCAMAHWGVAMTLFHPLWPDRPTAHDLEKGWSEVQMAVTDEPTTVFEQEFIASAAAFFEPGAGAYWERIRRWEEAARQLYEQFPMHHEAIAFYALAHLATASPSGGTDHQARAADLLSDILRENPSHPGAVHYTIHANDAPGRQNESLEVVRRYGHIAPRNPHALHMPTHIFVRLGEWNEVIAGNRLAAEAALEHPAGDRGQWVWDEYPHALEYLLYAHLQQGDDSAAARVLMRLTDTPHLQPSFKTAFHLSSMAARFALERRAWEEAAKLQPRAAPELEWDRFPWPEAVTWFARGIGSLRLRKVDDGARAEQKIGELREKAYAAGDTLFANQAEILRLGVKAWLEHTRGNDRVALQIMRDATALEATTPKHPVTPASTIPANELLGDLLLALGEPDEALGAFQASLVAAPGRLNGLLGAARAAASSGDLTAAATYYRKVADMAVEDSPRSGVREAFDFVAKGRGHFDRWIHD